MREALGAGSFLPRGFSQFYCKNCWRPEYIRCGPRGLFPMDSSELISKAIVFAAKAHAGQVDKRGEPYILHPLRVMFTIRDNGGSAEEQAAAVLHDVVEDTEVTLGRIRVEFGDVVHAYVDSVTRRGHWEPGPIVPPGEPKPQWVWDETYNEYIKRCCSSEAGCYIKEADVLDNADLRRHHPDAPYGRYIRTMCFIQTGQFKPEKE